MRKAIIILTTFILGACSSMARDNNPYELLSLINLASNATTQDNIEATLGKPARIEEDRKRTRWYYSNGNADFVISWSNKSESLVKFSFRYNDAAKKDLDNALPGQLKSGLTNLTQALKLLGTPKDITIKEKTQEIHYAYNQKVLRLFFRDRILVDYCLY